jgi:hypothetical protein
MEERSLKQKEKYSGCIIAVKNKAFYDIQIEAV